jgi:uncharacterized membrane protein
MADPVAMTQTAAAAAETVANPINWAGLVLTLSRWLHYVAGILWIGHLYFFNFVNGNLQADAKYPADMKKVVNPLLMTRALFMFRWGAMFTFVTGLILLGMIYDSGKALMFAASNLKMAYMLMGVVFGTIMWFNVWFIIWPRQKKMIGATQGGPAVDPSLAKQAGLASKVNTYLSVPLLLGMMGGAHMEYQLPGGFWGLLIGIVLGLGLVMRLYAVGKKVDTQIFKG